MKIANNIQMIEIKSERGTLYPVLISGDNELVMIDTAMPMQTEVLKKAVEQAGYTFDKITKVILTHQDLDHIGSAKILSDMGAEILAHELETPYIQGDKTSIRLSDMESRLDQLNEGERTFYERAKAGAPYFYVKVNQQLKDGEILDICGGIKIIHTPGHMPGHIALLLQESNILVAGDAANIADGKLVGADPNYSKDMGEAQVSFDKIISLKPASIVCYHGGVVSI